MGAMKPQAAIRGNQRDVGTPCERGVSHTGGCRGGKAVSTDHQRRCTVQIIFFHHQCFGIVKLVKFFGNCCIFPSILLPIKVI